MSLKRLVYELSDIAIKKHSFVNLYSIMNDYATYFDQQIELGNNDATKIQTEAIKYVLKNSVSGIYFIRRSENNVKPRESNNIK